MIDWIVNNQVGAIASVLGVIVSVIGFTVTLYNVARSKSAATRAETAAVEAQKSARLFDTVADVSKAISMMEEAKRLNRAGEWKVLLDRYGEIRRTLNEIRSANPNLNDTHKSDIQSTIGQLATIENSIEESLQKNVNPADVAKFNKLISRQIEKLDVVLVEIKSKQRE